MPMAYAQGCSQCRDNVNAASPKTQQGYRRAIGVMLVMGCGLFLAGLLVAKGYRKPSSSRQDISIN